MPCDGQQHEWLGKPLIVFCQEIAPRYLSGLGQLHLCRHVAVPEAAMMGADIAQVTEAVDPAGKHLRRGGRRGGAG